LISLKEGGLQVP